jgi:THUMP domain-like
MRRAAGSPESTASTSSDPARSLDLLLSPDGQELLRLLGGREGADLGLADREGLGATAAGVGSGGGAAGRRSSADRVSGGGIAGEGRVDPGVELALGERLRARYPAELVAVALAQHDLRVRARAKFSRAGGMYLTRDGLEQASSEMVALHRATRYADFGRVADLCAGIGGDLLALAPGRAALAVDHDPVHLRMALLNARRYGADDLAAACADVRDLQLDALPPAAFVDPARRIDGQRLPPGVSEPPLAWCVALAEHVSAVGIKAAPGLPLELVPAGWEVELIADRRELKEAMLWSPALATVPRRATVLPGGHSLVPETREPRSGLASGTRAPWSGVASGTREARSGVEVPCAPPAAFVLDPNPAVTRAGLVEELARGLDAWKIDRRIAFLSADHPLETPFGRLLVVEESMPWSLKRLRAALRARGAGAVQIRKRGSAVDVEDLRRRLDLRGDRQVTVILTRVRDRPWALICRDP